MIITYVRLYFSHECLAFSEQDLGDLEKTEDSNFRRRRKRHKMLCLHCLRKGL